MGVTALPVRIRLAEANCSRCDRSLLLSAEEQVTGQLHCPYCLADGPPRLPWDVRCPTCARTLRVSAAERAAGAFSCDRCHTVAALAANPEAGAVAAAEPPPADEVAQIKAATARAAAHDIKVGVAWLVGGVVASAATIAIGGGAGVYFTGAIIYGVFRIVRGTSRKA